MSLRVSLLVAFCLVLYTSLANATLDNENPRVEIKSGTIFGKVVPFSHADIDIERPVHSFKGIPYAEPPLAELRFKPPVAKTPWEGEYNATFHRPACPQAEVPQLPLNETTDEDCLHLNVYVPQPVPDNAAVMVWIHGGGFVMGSGADNYYDGIPLAAINDVIVVTINYRVGVLGFLTTGDSVASGNYGMLDQIEALKWIQNNIAAFGGDPTKVTIFGESAGAMSVNLLMVSPLSDGLFQRGIMQSGSATWDKAIRSDKEVANKLAHGIGKLVNCEKETSEELIECLRNVPADDFLGPQDVNTGMLANASGISEMMPFIPYVDGTFLPDSPYKLLEDKRVNKVDIMVGMLADESSTFMMYLDPTAAEATSLFVNKSRFEEFVQGAAMFSSLSEDPHLLEAAKLMYIDWEHTDDPTTDYFDAFVQMFSDEMMVCPTDKVVRALASAEVPTYYYSMSHSPSKSIWNVKWAKAAHGEDLAFVFGSHFRKKGDWPMSEEDIKVSLQVMKFWTNFGKTGNPNLSTEDAELTPEEKSIEWLPFTLPEMNYKDLSTSMQTKRALKARECAFWNNYLPALKEALEGGKKGCGEEAAENKYSEEVNNP